MQKASLKLSGWASSLLRKPQQRVSIEGETLPNPVEGLEIQRQSSSQMGQ